MTQNICIKRKSTKRIWNNVLILNKELILIFVDFFFIFYDGDITASKPTNQPMKETPSKSKQNTTKENNILFKV